MREPQPQKPDQQREGVRCGARLAPLYLVHGILVAVGVAWLVAILIG